MAGGGNNRRSSVGIGYNNTGGNGSNNTGSNIISGGGGGAAPAKDETCLAIERMEAERESRRQAMRDRKVERARETQRNIAAGNPGDVDFIGLVQEWREEHSSVAQPYANPSPTDAASALLSPSFSSPMRVGGDPLKICICVRKRPINDRERRKLDHDSVTVLHPTVWVHSAKFRVDGISKYLDHAPFQFDYAFDEDATTDELYKHCVMPLVDQVCAGDGCRATVFAYGQTGSGKTYTMSDIQNMVAEDLFMLLSPNLEQDGEYSADEFDRDRGRSKGRRVCTLDTTSVHVSYFELYGGRIQDLLNKRHRLKILEDGKGNVVVSGLQEYEAADAEKFLALAGSGNEKRTTHATEANDTSSRSHAVCQILLRDKDTRRVRGKLSLVDLAGSERGSDTKSHNRQRRTESSEINKSLLALKECIRALDCGKGVGHVPYRASKLTLVLKDCFTSKMARTTMIATVSPGSSSSDHTTNTLRYADRIKERKVTELLSKTPPKNQKIKVRNIATTVKEIEQYSDHEIDDDFLQEEEDVLQDNAQSDNYIENRPYSDNEEDDESVSRDGDSDLRVEENYQGSNLARKVHDAIDESKFRETVQMLFEEEENLLNMHMSVIQENAELLTEEGQMLQSLQRDEDYDVDVYASRLEQILERKELLISDLQGKVKVFRTHLAREEELSMRVGRMSDP